MEQRIVVMNGQRLLQTVQEGEWKVTKVDKAVNIRPGIYNLYRASDADKSKQYVGTIVHSDKEYVYQHNGKGMVRHVRSDLAVIPENGALTSISYDEEGQAKVLIAAATLSRGHTR